MKPPTPDELGDRELEAEGMMFVGDKGKILAGFLGEDPKILPEQKMSEYRARKGLPEKQPTQRGGGRRTEAPKLWAAACKGGPHTYGDFLLAGPISDAFNLGAVSLRMGGRKLLFDSAKAEVTNVAEANKYLTREYRKGWELPLAGA
jgi:hypothetical protein